MQLKISNREELYDKMHRPGYERYEMNFDDPVSPSNLVYNYEGCQCKRFSGQIKLFTIKFAGYGILSKTAVGCKFGNTFIFGCRQAIVLVNYLK